MKILFIHDFYQRFGGEDAVALSEKQLLEDHGEEVIPYTRHNDEIKDYGLLRKLTLPAQVMYSRQTQEDIRGLVEKHRPDVAYIHNFFPLISPSVYPALKSMNVPAIQVVHDFRMLCPNGVFYTQGEVCERCKHGNFLNAVRYRCYRDSYFASAVASSVVGLHRLAGGLDKIDGYICLTEFTRLKLLEVGVSSNKLFVKPNFVDATQVEPALRRRPTTRSFWAGSPREKGLWTLIRAFEKMPHLPLKIAGTGPLEQELRQYVASPETTRPHRVRGLQTGPRKMGSPAGQSLRGDPFGVV